MNKQLTHLDKNTFYKLLSYTFDYMIKNSQDMGDLDALIGDGDLGVTISLAFTAAKKRLEEVKENKISEILFEIGLDISDNAASTFGILLCTMFMSASKVTKDIEIISLEDGLRMLNAAIIGVQEKGKANRGEKTVLDAMIPAKDALENALISNLSAKSCITAALEAAKSGAESTKEMKAKTGRAYFFQERSIGIMDPGALAFVTFLEGMNRYFEEMEWKQDY